MQTAKTVNYTVRLDVLVKEESEKLFNDLGLTLSSALNIFLRQALQAQGFPFAIKREQPFNKTTLAAMREAVEIANDPEVKTHSSVRGLMEDLEK